jgi:hypothetical protein
MRSACKRILVWLLLSFCAGRAAQGQQGRQVKEREPNDSLATANPIAIGDTIVGEFSPACDQDVFVLNIPAGTRLMIDRTGPSYLPGISLRDSTGAYTDPTGYEYGWLDEWTYAREFPIVKGGKYFLTAALVWLDSPSPAACAQVLPTPYNIRVNARPEPLGPGDPLAVALPGLQITPWRVTAGRANDLWAWIDNGVVTHIHADGTYNVVLQSFSPSGSDRPAGGYAVDGFGDVLVAGESLDRSNGSFNGRSHCVLWRASSGTGAYSVLRYARTWPCATGLAVGPNGDIWSGPSAAVSETGGIGAAFFWHYTPLGDLIDSVDVSGVVDLGGTIAPGSPVFSPDGRLYFGGLKGVARVANNAAELVIPADVKDLIYQIAFDRDGYLYVLRGSGWQGRVALYDPSLRLINETLAHAPWQETVLFALDRDGAPSSRLLVGGGSGARLAEIDPRGVRAPGYQPPGLLPIDLQDSKPAQVADAYAAALTLRGAPGTVRWTQQSGSLPPGVTLNETTGELAGVPQQGGSFTFTVRGQSQDRYGFARFTISVASLSLTLQDLVNVFLGGPPLPDSLASFLDQQGNRNGRFDIGDVRIYMQKQGLSR